MAILKQCVIGLLIFFTMSATSARMLFVPDDYATIQAAVNAADTGDEVVVRDGIYEGEGFRDIRFMGKAITVRSENGPEHCIIDGINAPDTSRAFIFDQGEISSSILKGFTITRFQNCTVLITESSPMILDCTFHDNSARAIDIHTPWDTVVVANSRFTDNNSNSAGGAIHATYGQIDFSGNYFSNNRGVLHGGAIALYYITGFISDSEFFSNVCDYNDNSYGGAISAWLSSVTITNCLFVDNVVRGSVTGTYHGMGGAVFLNGSGQSFPNQMINCTIYGNRVVNSGSFGGAYLSVNSYLYSSIVWNNSHGNFFGLAVYSIIQGGNPGEGNSGENPQFYLPDDDYFYLLSTSPAINAGHHAASSVCFNTPDGEICLDMLTTSPDGTRDTGMVNMGYHYHHAAPGFPTATPTFTPTVTPTPGPYDELYVTIEMPSTMYHPGDLFWCHVNVTNNSSEPLVNYPLFVVLDVYGMLFFAPDFTEFGNYLDEYPWFDTGTTVIEVAPKFSWPDGAGSATDILWIAALTNPAITHIVGEWDMISFGWTESPAPTATPTSTPPAPTATPPPPPDGFVYIPPGTFVRGSPNDEPCRHYNEGPQHKVTLTRGFYMMTTEVTRQMWADLKSAQPTLPDDLSDTQISPTMNHPVQRVTWYQTILFANLMSLRDGLTPCYYKDAQFTIPVDESNYSSDLFYCDFNANGYRLPTEAEWEYAARAGSTGPFSSDEPNYNSDTCIGCSPNPPLEVLDSIAWWCGNANDKAHPVATKLPNPWGLYDMHGNVEEICWDRFAMPYPSDDVTDPAGPPSGSFRVVRGGSWRTSATGCRSANRSTVYMNGGTERFRGFRLVQTVPQ